MTTKEELEKLNNLSLSLMDQIRALHEKLDKVTDERQKVLQQRMQELKK